LNDKPTLKTGKLLNRGKSQNAQNAYKSCIPEFIVRLLYGGFIKPQDITCFRDPEKIAL